MAGWPGYIRAMLFDFNAHSALLLPFVVPGLALAGYLGVRAGQQSRAADGLLALLLLLVVLPIAQWMLGYAGWYDSHDGHSTLMFYLPWRPWPGLGPVLYLYFEALVNQEFAWRGRRRHLLPLLAYAGSYALAAALDLGLRHGLQGAALPLHFGTKGLAANALDGASGAFEWLGYALLLAYGLATLRRYCRYRRYLDDHFSDTEQLRFAGFRDLLRAALLLLLLGLGVRAVELLRGPLDYDGYWYAFVGNGLLLYALMVVGLQANGAARAPLRFGAAAADAALAGAPVPPVAGAPVPAVAGAPVPAAAAPVPPVAGAAASAAALAAQSLAPEIPSEAVAQTLSETTPLASFSADAHAPPESSSLASPPEASSPGLPPELHPWRTRLLALMADEQPWLEPELTLTELAHRLRTNPSVLSRVINSGCGQNFNDFVNTYRVAEAARKLADPRLGHYSLVGVALESGFNSKSTFNRVFKKLRGITPGEIARPGAKS